MSSLLSITVEHYPTTVVKAKVDFLRFVGWEEWRDAKRDGGGSVRGAGHVTASFAFASYWYADG
jgi:hypothetical protein